MSEPAANVQPDPVPPSKPRTPSQGEGQGAAAAQRNSSAPASLRERVKSLRLADRPPPRRSLLGLVPWVLFFIFFGSTVVLAMRRPDSSNDANAATGRDRNTSQTKAEDSTLAVGDAMLESKGYIVCIQQIQVSPKVSGMVMDLRIKEGKEVKKGDVLAVLEKVEYESDRDHVLGQLDAARSRWMELRTSLSFQVYQAEADLADAIAQLQQEIVQYEGEKNAREATSQVDLLRRKATVDAKKARVEWHKNQVAMIHKGQLARKVAAASAEVHQYRADLAKANWRLENCEVKAPVTGIILTKRAEEGSLVNPSAFSNGLSASLCDMADLGELEVDLSIPERDVGRLIDFKLKHASKPQKCVIRADAFPKKPYFGYLSRIMPTADQSKAAVPVRVKIVIPAEDVGVYLRPQMNAAVTFLNQEYPLAENK